MNVDAMKDAARAAIKNIKGAVTGRVHDQDVELYQKLKPSDFPHLIERYGLDDTLAYIKEMEKRMGRKV